VGAGEAHGLLDEEVARRRRRLGLADDRLKRALEAPVAVREYPARAEVDALGIVFFATEEDLRQGDATLNTMSPPNESLGSRASVEFYEVALNFTA
jgi:hypothetical protein